MTTTTTKRPKATSAEDLAAKLDAPAPPGRRHRFAPPRPPASAIPAELHGLLHRCDRIADRLATARAELEHHLNTRDAASAADISAVLAAAESGADLEAGTWTAAWEQDRTRLDASVTGLTEALDVAEDAFRSAAYQGEMWERMRAEALDALAPAVGRYLDALDRLDAAAAELATPQPLIAWITRTTRTGMAPTTVDPEVLLDKGADYSTERLDSIGQTLGVVLPHAHLVARLRARLDTALPTPAQAGP